MRARKIGRPDEQRQVGWIDGRRLHLDHDLVCSGVSDLGFYKRQVKLSTSRHERAQLETGKDNGPSEASTGVFDAFH